MLHCHAVVRGSVSPWVSLRRLLWKSAALAVVLSSPCVLTAGQEIPPATAPQVYGPQPQTPCRPLQANPSGSERQKSGSQTGPVTSGNLEDANSLHAAAALEMDYNGSFFGPGGRRTTGQGNASFWEGGIGTESAWYVLVWVWLCGALIATLVFVTYRRLALRQMMQEPSGPTDKKGSSVARHSSTPPPSVNAASADPWRRKP
jgi:hypothetical protein